MSERADVVNRYMQELDHPLKAEIERVRSIILDSCDGITEHIKWNAPSFCYGGDDRVTLKLYPPTAVQLIFHRGANAKDNSNFTFDDDTGLLKWPARDRAVLTLRSMADIEAHGDTLRQLVNRWLEATLDRNGA